MLRNSRRNLSWVWPLSLRLILCKLGWHYWRYNLMYYMIHAPWLRKCNDCNKLQAYSDKWRDTEFSNI